jgi:hypothetical protein
MDRYERMRSGDWPGAGDAPNFPRLSGRVRTTQNQREWLADAGRAVLALTLLALLAAFVR